MRFDVAACAAALVQLASKEAEDGLDTAMVRQACAVVEKHGEAGVYGLVVALARLAAAGPGTSLPSTATSTSVADPPRVAHSH